MRNQANETFNPNPSQESMSLSWPNAGELWRKKTGHEGPAALVHGVWYSQGFAPQDSQSSPTKSHPRQTRHVNSLYPTPNTSVSPFRCLSLAKPVRQVMSVQPPEGPYWLLVIQAGLNSDVTCPGQPCLTQCLHSCPLQWPCLPGGGLSQHSQKAASSTKSSTTWHRWTDAHLLGPPLSPQGLVCCCVMSDSFATPWTVAHQVPPSMGFPRQEYWSGLLFLLQESLLTQRSNLSLLHWQADSLPLSQQWTPEV